MKLNKLQQRIVSILEPLPIENNHLAPTGIIEPLQIKIGETITGWLRSLRRGQPMIWDPWILKDGDIYRMFYLKGIEGQDPWWTISNICGAISTDMDDWQDLGTILEQSQLIIGNPEEYVLVVAIKKMAFTIYFTLLVAKNHHT
jgi:beta-fructofuranosidase